MKTRHTILLIACAILPGLNVSMAAEPNYPTKPVELSVGVEPGGGIDLSARMIAERIKPHLGQEMVVVNKPGAGGRVALTFLSKAKPDGYSLTSVGDPAIVLIPHLEKVMYDPIDDFTSVIQYGSFNIGYSVLADSPFQSIKDLIAFARANPEKLTVCSMAVDSPGSIGFQAMALHEGVKVKIVPFSGSGPAISAVLGGHVTVAGTSLSSQMPHIKAKKFRLLAVMGDERDPAYPETPTLKELGYPIVLESWYYIYGPKNMEKPVVKKLEEAFRKVIDSPEFTKFAQERLFWVKRPVAGEDLRTALVRRHKEHGELLKKLGMIK